MKLECEGTLEENTDLDNQLTYEQYCNNRKVNRKERERERVGGKACCKIDSWS